MDRKIVGLELDFTTPKPSIILGRKSSLCNTCSKGCKEQGVVIQCPNHAKAT